MSAKITWLQAVAHMGDEGRLSLYLKGDDAATHPTFDAAASVADGILRSRLTARYTTASYDALDSTTIPTYVQFYLFCMLLGVATSHDEARPDAINQYAGVAAGWLDDVMGGKAKIPELTEIPSVISGSGGGSVARVSGPTELVFDRCNTSGDFRTRERKI